MHAFRACNCEAQISTSMAQAMGNGAGTFHWPLSPRENMCTLKKLVRRLNRFMRFLTRTILLRKFGNTLMAE